MKNDKQVLVDGRVLTLVILTSNKSRGYLDRLFEKYKDDIYRNVKSGIKEIQYVFEAGEIDLAFRTRKAIRLMNLLEFRQAQLDDNPTEENKKLYEEINHDMTTAAMSVSDSLMKANRAKSMDVYYDELKKNIINGNEEEVMIELASYALVNSNRKPEDLPAEHNQYKEMGTKLFLYFSNKKEYEVEYIEKVVEIRKKLELDSVKTLGDLYKRVSRACEKDKVYSELCETIFFVGHITEVCNLDFDRFRSNTVSRKEMNQIIDIALIYSFNDENDEEILVKIYLGVMLFIINKAFENDRNLFFENTDAIYELESKIASSNAEEKNAKIEQLKKDLESKDKEIERLRKELREQQLETVRMETQKIDEINKLEELLIDALKNDEEYSDEIKDKSKLESLVFSDNIDFEDKTIEENIYIVGGYPSLINKLKERIPNINWIYKERQIKGHEKNIFLLTNLVGHGMRFRLDAMGTEYVYINGMSPNIIFNEIYSILNVHTKFSRS